MSFGPISALAVKFNSSKYWSIYHARHWLRWHLRFECCVRRNRNQNPFFEMTSIKKDGARRQKGVIAGCVTAGLERVPVHCRR